MSTTVRINIDPTSIINSHHLQDGGQAQKLLANEILRFSDPYTPLDTSMLKSNVSISRDGKQIIYNSPYASYQYNGVSKNGNFIRNQGAPMRGRKWVARMWADRGNDIKRTIANYVGGRVD